MPFTTGYCQTTPVKTCRRESDGTFAADTHICVGINVSECFDVYIFCVFICFILTVNVDRARTVD